MLRHAFARALELVCLMASEARPQEVRLPAVEPPTAISPGGVLLAPEADEELLVPSFEPPEPPPDPDRPPDARDGLVQKLIFTATAWG